MAILNERQALTKPNWRGLLAAVQDVLLVVVVSWFVVAHVRLVLDGRFSSIFFAIEQAVTVALFVLRRRSNATSSRVSEWAAAGLGTWLPLLLRSSEGPFAAMTAFGVALQVVGLSCGIIGFLYLGRSFGIVAADRGLKVNGPYGLVRHPVYLGHLVTLLGLLIANPTVLNLGLETVIVGSVLLRILAEERVLRGSAPYRSYAAVVPWRLLPRVY